MKTTKTMKTTIKGFSLLFFVGLLIFTRSLSAQIILNIQGNVSDFNGNPIANHDVYFSDDTNGVNFGIAITNVNGDYSGVFTANPNTPIGGILFVATEDCNFNMVLNTHAFTSTTPLPIISDFIICNSSSNPCSLGGASVNNTPNGLSVSINGGTPPYTYIWSNGTTGYWSQFYQNWCVSIVDANGCDTTICDSTSNPTNCQAAFQSYLIGFNPNAVPVMVQFDDWSLPQGAMSSWLWDFGDGTTDNTQNPVHAYQVPGVYYACLTITANLSNGTVCTSTYCDSVWADTIGINPPPSCYANFYSTQVSASDTTFFFNMSGGTTTSTSYFWDFGDGSTSTDENPAHLYAMSGWYNICLTIMDSSNNCYDTYCDLINIVIGGTGCQSYFISNPGWALNSYEFYDYSGGNITNWTWDFGDGTTSNLQNPIHTYNASGTSLYLVCLTIEVIDPSTGAVVCIDTYCDSVYLLNQQTCFADFYGQNIGNNEAQFYNNSYPQTGPTWGGIAEVDINYGDGNGDYNIGSSVNHTYTNAGTYYVCVTVTETDSSGNIACTDTYCDSVTVTSGTIPCQADFYATQDSLFITNNPSGGGTPYMAEVFFFSDISTPIGQIQFWQWDMGDNGMGQYLMQTSSSSQFPVYEYDTTGVYYVCLSITTYSGCTSTFCDSLSYLPMIGQTGIENSVIQGLALYPNPVRNILNIEMTTFGQDELKINIINMIGQIVLSNNTTVFGNTKIVNLDVSQLSNGVYFVEVILGKERKYQRVVIHR